MLWLGRLPPSFKAEQCRRVAETVIDVLGMSHIKHNKIGDETTRGISGGQRKRVNIAMELTAKPSILFLDEPTSGLDATSSLQLIKALRATAKQGITVAAVLHQPRYEMFCLFHDVLLLGKGGFTVYLGPATQAKAYFESVGYVFPAEINPADYLLDIIGTPTTPNNNTSRFCMVIIVGCCYMLYRGRSGVRGRPRHDERQAARAMEQRHRLQPGHGGASCCLLQQRGDGGFR
jgi:ABC-type multidrug transport system ATPase subunit